MDELVKRLREEASEWCSNCCYRCGDNVCGAPDDRKNDCDIASKLQAADAIEEMEGKHFMMKKTAEWLAEKVPRWIPVAERLPEKGYYVLAYEDDDILMASYADGNWVLRDLYEIIDDLKPTHWMPLPEPPKEE